MIRMMHGFGMLNGFGSMGGFGTVGIIFSVLQLLFWVAIIYLIYKVIKNLNVKDIAKNLPKTGIIASRS
ncbi:hypothetical protein [Niallia sp. Krafla_26]|uniref:hypothetical protein n=1 Tax=Niallia sp. Krafla_26 TaxID=3064703 RepID=UPI003D16E1A3